MEDLELFQQLRAEATAEIGDVILGFIVVLAIAMAVVVLVFAWRAIPFREALRPFRPYVGDSSSRRGKLAEVMQERDRPAERVTQWDRVDSEQANLGRSQPTHIDSAPSPVPADDHEPLPTSFKVIELLSWTLGSYGEGKMSVSAMLRVFRVQGVSNRQWALAWPIYELISPFAGWQPLPRYLRRVPSARRWRTWLAAAG